MRYINTRLLLLLLHTCRERERCPAQQYCVEVLCLCSDLSERRRRRSGRREEAEATTQFVPVQLTGTVSHIAVSGSSYRRSFALDRETAAGPPPPDDCRETRFVYRRPTRGGCSPNKKTTPERAEPIRGRCHAPP